MGFKPQRCSGLLDGLITRFSELCGVREVVCRPEKCVVSLMLEVTVPTQAELGV